MRPTHSLPPPLTDTAPADILELNARSPGQNATHAPIDANSVTSVAPNEILEPRRTRRQCDREAAEHEDETGRRADPARNTRGQLERQPADGPGDDGAAGGNADQRQPPRGGRRGRVRRFRGLHPGPGWRASHCRPHASTRVCSHPSPMTDSASVTRARCDGLAVGLGTRLAFCSHPLAFGDGAPARHSRLPLPPLASTAVPVGVRRIVGLMRRLALLASPRRWRGAPARHSRRYQIFRSRPSQNGARISRFSVLPAALRGKSSITITRSSALVFRRDARVDPLLEILRGNASGFAQHDRRDRGLAPFVVRDAEHGDFADGRMVRGDLLDVLRIDLHAAGIDHVLLAVDEVEKSVLVDVAEIAREQPAIAQRLLRSAPRD